MESLFESVTKEHFHFLPKQKQSKSGRHAVKSDKKRSVKKRSGKKRSLSKRLRTLSSVSSDSEMTVSINPSLREILADVFRTGLLPPQTRFPRHLRFAAPPHGLHYDRTLREWLQYLEKSRQHATAFPFYRKEVAEMERYFYGQQYLRRLTEKYANRWMRRWIDTKPYDNCDLYTTIPVPLRAQVVVYDYPNRKKYVFHTHTAVKMIEASLHYSCYGIAKPSQPKNPYTNVPWSFGQLLCIHHQIFRNLLHNHTLLPQYLVNFRLAEYSVRRYYVQNKKHMDILAAKNFFLQKDDPYRDSIYEEVVNDLHTELALFPKVTGFVMRRQLPADILQAWDDVVLASYLETNLHTYTDKFKSAREIEEGVLVAYERTLEHRRSLRRPRNPFTTPIPANNRSLVNAPARLLVRSLNADLSFDSLRQNLFGPSLIDEAQTANEIVLPTDNTLLQVEMTLTEQPTGDALQRLSNSIRELLITSMSDTKTDE
jgi:hypothetical protein